MHVKKIITLAALTLAGAAVMAQTCIITNETLTQIGSHDTFGGELQNDSGVDILFHEFRVAFLDDDNDVVETKTAAGCLRSLQDGASDFFSVASTLPAADTDMALARLANFAEDPDFTIGQTADGDIAIDDVAAVRTGASLTVSGTITNSDDDSLDEPVVCAVVYNEDGRVVVTGKDTAIADLDEGDSEPFSIAITVPNDESDVDHVDVWADGLESGTPSEPVSELDVSVALATPTPGTSTSTPEPATPTATPTP
jgi:hypothetical protein